MSPRIPTAVPTVRIEGLPFSALTMSEVVEHVAESLESRRDGWIVTPNLDILRRWKSDAGFRALVDGATLFTPDGMPVLWLSRILGKPLRERVAGSDLFGALCERCARQGWRVYFLGGNPGVAEKARQVMESRFPGLVVCGTHCPPFGFEQDTSELQLIEQQLTSARPDIVFVGLGSPKQEALIARFKPSLPGIWWAGIGITFSFACGEVARAPRWMQNAGLEWVHRLAQEPRRLFRRYVVDGGPFLAAAVIRCLHDRMTGAQDI